MASPITIIKNNVSLFKVTDKQEAARFLAEHLNTTKYKCYDPIERGYVYNIPFFVGEDEYRFVAPNEIAANRRKRSNKHVKKIFSI